MTAVLEWPILYFLHSSTKRHNILGIYKLSLRQNISKINFTCCHQHEGQVET